MFWCLTGFTALRHHAGAADIAPQFSSRFDQRCCRRGLPQSAGHCGESRQLRIGIDPGHDGTSHPQELATHASVKREDLDTLSIPWTTRQADMLRNSLPSSGCKASVFTQVCSSLEIQPFVQIPIHVARRLPGGCDRYNDEALPNRIAGPVPERSRRAAWPGAKTNPLASSTFLVPHHEDALLAACPVLED